MRRILTRALLLSLLAFAASCRQPETTEQASQPGQCPKVEGSFFGTDKAQLTKGEAVQLLLKLPREYVNAQLRVERPGDGDTSNLQFDLKALQDAANPPQLDAAKFPVWIERGFAEARPARTERYILKATGPEGCAPLELPATVAVIEPEEGGASDAPGGACMDLKLSKFWAAPQAENKNRLRLVWDVPNALSLEVDGRATEVKRGSMIVELDGREPAMRGEDGRPSYVFKLVARREGCETLTSTATYKQIFN